MNEHFTQPSDNYSDFAAAYLRRADSSAPARNPAELSDPAPAISVPEEQHHDPERWDGLS